MLIVRAFIIEDFLLFVWVSPLFIRIVTRHLSFAGHAAKIVTCRNTSPAWI